MADNKRKLLALKFAYQILTDKRNRDKYSTMFIFSEKAGIEMYFGDMLDALNDIAKGLKEGGTSDG